MGSRIQDLISRQGIPRAGDPSKSLWKPVFATGGFIVDGKYKFYGSKAPDPGGDDAQVLDEGSNVDNFVNQLSGNCIILKTVPSGSDAIDIQLDASDGLATWMGHLDSQGLFNLTLKPNPEPAKGPWVIDAFSFQYKSPWDITFSSKEKALKFSFPPPAETFESAPGLDPNAPRIPAPGLEPDGKTLYLGLDPDRTKEDLHSTVKELFDFSESSRTPPALIADWKTTLVVQGVSAAGKRNGLWIRPSRSLQTSIRLQFSLDSTDVETFNKAITSTLKGFTFDSLDVICKKAVVLADTDDGNQPVAQGSVIFQAKCTIKPEGKSDVPVIAAINFYHGSYNITVQLNTKDAFGGILKWLMGLVPDLDLNFISEFLGDKDMFEQSGIYPRQIKIGLSCDDKGRNTKLKSFSFEIEVAAKFGTEKTGAGKPATPTFLVSYAWMADGPKWGSIKGELWNWYDDSVIRDMQPEYETTTDLYPLTDTPAKTLNLIKMIPGADIENVPSTVPTQISRAYVTLSRSGVRLGGTIESRAFESDNSPSVPQLDLGLLSIDAGFTWEGKKDFTLTIAFLARLQPAPTSVHKETALLKGGIDYSSGTGKWELKASLNSLYASSLYELFCKPTGASKDTSTADHVMPLIESIQVKSLDLAYHYESVKDGEDKGKSVGSAFELEGILLAAGLELDLKFHHFPSGSFTFIADLKSAEENASVSDVIKGILGDDSLELPGFLDNMAFGNEKDSAIHIEVLEKVLKGEPKETPDEKAFEVQAAGAKKKGSFQFIATLTLGNIKFSFVQLHQLDWESKVPSKRFFKASLTSVPTIEIPLVGNLTQPFEEMYFMWIQDNTNKNPKREPGLTRLDIKSLEDSMSLTTKDKFKEKDDSDLLMSAGSHFGVIIKDSEGKSVCILDYDFKKKADAPEKQSTFALMAVEEEESEEEKPPKADSDGGSASAPFKKKAGPLSINNMSLKYTDQILRIGFDATFELGPIGFSLLGFTINLKLTSLDLSKIEIPKFSLEGFAVAFEKPPLTIAGIVRHGNIPGLNYYAGGLIVGWVPYQLQAAGFYGEAKPQNRDSFVSVFVFARLDGPLVTLEFAEISGVTGGFGYNSEIRVPKVAEITEFPFIDQSQLSGTAGDALKTLEKLTDPRSEAGGWFTPRDDTYWAAAGMKIDAFQMISLDAVVVVMFGQSVKLGIYAVALVDIPNAKSPVKFAHVELGLGVTVDFGYGTMKVEGQLSPKSFILDPNCHLTGGFALYYWFDATHADKSLVGNFVFTLGGYHQAFRIPDGWPNPPRLGISWSLGSHLSLSGEAYFAITPKVCMGGGRLHAAFSAGPIEAWFDAFANFLINYKPFYFTSNAGICVGVRFNIDVLFIHTHISVEIGADLSMWGPPLAGRVHVDIKVAKFDINFGGNKGDNKAADIKEFYHLVLQASSQPAESRTAEEKPALVAEDEGDILPGDPNQGHTFLATSGLLNNSSSPDRKQNADWTVRGGSFSFVVGCKIAVQDVKQVDENNNVVNSVSSKGPPIYARPMHLREAMTKSEMKIEIVQDGVARAKWDMTQEYKQVPTGLWAKYDESQDPTKSSQGNNIDDLLDNNSGSLKLMMGVLMQGPPAIMSEDTLKAFNILAQGERVLKAKKPFPETELPEDAWDPSKPKDGAEQWKDVHNNWSSPEWSGNTDGGSEVQQTFVDSWFEIFGWGKALSGLGKLPKLLGERFDDLYVEAPLITV
ncbi:hypothetical protein CEK26_003488 [Fusarium fujikuroi]|uniref:DUF6603 domain-containing protein n=1 Tax=Fusarium fujikuroi TaxID=5127 RepID=A0A5Q3GF80_FUSFU|nr:hypothetical protein CEK27_003480 [Fusarium fujikuroi]QGJ02044.1 hypothetical protein CEK26_003488 [Fusarium fujikuroi]SCN70810.1 uncharacterized protein FFE2_02125 [Fusarium fujikuroi]VTT68215.1 unnamed protein product [Fusarium fujikuroi]VTT76258.1 unnamed protein product [Fusarium fujikuroi]